MGINLKIRSDKVGINSLAGNEPKKALCGRCSEPVLWYCEKFVILRG